MKHPPMDLSRFQNCSIKKAAICDLLMVKEFRDAADAYAGEITDQWIIDTAERLAIQLKVKPADAAKYMDEGFPDLLERRRKAYKTVITQCRYFRNTFGYAPNYHKTTNYIAQKKYYDEHFITIQAKIYKAHKDTINQLAQERHTSISKLIIQALEAHYGIDLSKPADVPDTAEEDKTENDK